MHLSSLRLFNSSIVSLRVLALAGSACLVLAGCGGGGGGGATSGAATGGVSTGVVAGGGATVARTVTLPLESSGTRGSVPLTVQVSGKNVSYTSLNTTGVQNLTGDANTQVQITAPDAYADRKFVGWQRDGQMVTGSPTLTFTPGALPGNGTLTAAYAEQSSTTGYAPNFSRAGFPHWASFPLRVYLNSTITPGSEKETSILNGINRWVAATGGVVSYERVTAAAGADIEIGVGETPAGSAGLCDVTWNDNSELTHASITLNPTTPTSRLEIVTQNLDTIAAHEFGHALGMTGEEGGAGHSTDAADTMFASGNTPVGLITARDVNTLANVYPALFSGATRGVARAKSAAGKTTGTLHHARVF